MSTTAKSTQRRRNSTAKLAKVARPAPFRFAVAVASIGRSEYGNPLPELSLVGPADRDAFRRVSAAAHRVAADVEELIDTLPAGFADVRFDVCERARGVWAARLFLEPSDGADLEGARRVLHTAGQVAIGAAGWTYDASGARVIVSVPR